MSADQRSREDDRSGHWWILPSGTA
jgi:hypothetical protein